MAPSGNLHTVVDVIYWLLVLDAPANKRYLYHVVNGSKGSALDESGAGTFYPLCVTGQVRTVLPHFA